jgi:hypothetical protein
LSFHLSIFVSLFRFFFSHVPIGKLGSRKLGESCPDGEETANLISSREFSASSTRVVVTSSVLALPCASIYSLPLGSGTIKNLQKEIKKLFRWGEIARGKMFQLHTFGGNLIGACVPCANLKTIPMGNISYNGFF